MASYQINIVLRNSVANGASITASISPVERPILYVTDYRVEYDAAGPISNALVSVFVGSDGLTVTNNTGSSWAAGKILQVSVRTIEGWSQLAGRVLGFSAATQIPEIVFDQSKGGKYLFTQYDSTYGAFCSSLSIATGTLSSMSKTSLKTQTDVSSLKDDAGGAITAGDVTCGWWLSETRFLFVGRKLSNNKYYVWMCNYNGSAWTVGSNSTTFDNGNAVLALGTYSGGQADLSGILHSHSMAVKSSTEAVIAEYNINASRSNGSTNDAVRVYRTTDGGATWSAVLTFNTSGNQIRHAHAARYDKWTGEYYFVFGDDPNSAIVRWDGSSSSPSANTALTQAGIGATSGWECMHDSLGLECRSGSIAIHPDSVHFMCDNSEVNLQQTYAFTVTKQRPMARVQSYGYDRTKGRPPLICCETPNGGAFWASMREATDGGAEDWKGYDFWHTPDGITFVKIAKTRDNSTISSGVITSFFMTNEGKIVIAGTNSKGTKLLPVTASTNGQGSLVVTPVIWTGDVRSLQTLA